MTETVTPTVHPDSDKAPEPVASLSPTGMLMSLTGFDEIAITMNFGQKVGTLREEDSITLGRALAFVHFRRTGEKDRDAYELAMTLPIEGVTTFFQPEPPAPEPTEEEAERITTNAQDMAAWVIATGIAPSEYKALTISERVALTEEHNRVVEYVESRRGR